MTYGNGNGNGNGKGNGNGNGNGNELNYCGEPIINVGFKTE